MKFSTLALHSFASLALVAPTPTLAAATGIRGSTDETVTEQKDRGLGEAHGIITWSGVGKAPNNDNRIDIPDLEKVKEKWMPGCTAPNATLKSIKLAAFRSDYMIYVKRFFRGEDGECGEDFCQELLEWGQLDQGHRHIITAPDSKESTIIVGYHPVPKGREPLMHYDYKEVVLPDLNVPNPVEQYNKFAGELTFSDHQWNDFDIINVYC